MIAEYGYSAFSGESQVTMAGALLNADIVGRFLMLGGREAYLYGWEPTLPDKNPDCDSWGNNMLFLSDSSRRIIGRVATYHGLKMMTQDWTQPRGEHVMYATESSARDTAANELVSAYVIRRPDGAWSALVVNKDPSHSYRVRLAFDSAAGPRRGAAARAVRFTPAQYAWKADAERGRPLRSDPPVRTTLRDGEPLVIAPWSMAVVTVPAPKPRGAARP